MVRKILDATDPKLRQKSKQVKKIDKKVLSLIKDLKDTLIVQTDPEGVGLAAPQIGKNFRVFVMDAGDGIKTVINPKVFSVYGKPKVHKKAKKELEMKNKTMEGCLSLPHYYGPLERARKVKLEFLNEKGEKMTRLFKDFEAQIVLHELDHLNGKLFVDRLLEQKRPLYELVEGEWYEVDIL